MAQTKEQLRKLRQKYHLGEYRKTKGKVFKSHSAKSVMAKRKRSTHKKRYSRGGSSAFSLQNVLIGTGLVMLYNAYVSPKIPLSQTPRNLVEAGAGYIIGKKSGLLGAFGKMLFITNVYDLMVTNVSPMITSSGIIATNTGEAYY